MHFNLSRTKAMVVPTQEAFSIAEQYLEAVGLRASERPGGLVARCAVAGWKQNYAVCSWCLCALVVVSCHGEC